MPGLAFTHAVFGLDVDVDVLVCHPNAESYKDLIPQQIYRQHENEKKRMYPSGVMEVELATVHENRWHGTRMSSLSQATSGTAVSQERRGLLDYDVLDKNQNLICHSENIPPMLKGISFNEESKSQPKRNGLRHRKRTLRTLDFDLVKRY